MKHRIRDELQWVVLFLAVIWIVFLLDFLPFVNLLNFGLTPRTTTGLVGIAVMPFLHVDWRHISGNTSALFVLLILLAGSKANSWRIVAQLVLLGGGLLWLFGRSVTHVGASGLIFGLMVFLILSGLLEKRIVPLVVAIAVGFLYGGSLLSGIIPKFGSHVSWDGHLFGAIAGGITAYVFTFKSNDRLTSRTAAEH